MATRSDHQGPLVERDHQPSAYRFLDRELVVSAPQILDERMPTDDPCAAVPLEPAHRAKPCLQPAVITLARLLAYRSVGCQAAGSSASGTIGEVAARVIFDAATVAG